MGSARAFQLRPPRTLHVGGQGWSLFDSRGPAVGKGGGPAVLFLQSQKGQRPGQKTRALRYVKEQLDAFDWPLPASDPVEPDEIALTSDSASEIALVCGLRYPLERR